VCFSVGGYYGDTLEQVAVELLPRCFGGSWSGGADEMALERR